MFGLNLAEFALYFRAWNGPYCAVYASRVSLCIRSQPGTLAANVLVYAWSIDHKIWPQTLALMQGAAKVLRTSRNGKCWRVDA